MNSVIRLLRGNNQMVWSSNTRTYLLLSFSTIIWGSAFIAAKYSTAELHPTTVAFFRFFGAAIILYITMLIREPKRPRLSKNDWLVFVVLGLVGIFGYNTLFFYGVMLSPITKSSLIIATNPILITVLSIIFLKEKIVPLQAVGISLGITGAFIIITEGSLQEFIELGFTKPDLYLVGAVICWAIYSVVGKVSLTNYSPLVATTYACISGTIFLAPLGIYYVSVEDVMNLSLVAGISIIHMAVFVSGLSFVLWYDGIKKIGAARAASFINLMPISAVFLAWVFFGEIITLPQLIGAVLVLCGVYLSNRKK